MDSAENSDTAASSAGRGIDSRRRFIRGEDLLRWWRDWGRSTLAYSPSGLRQPSRMPASAVGQAGELRDPADKRLGQADTTTAASPTNPGFFTHLSKSAMACQWDVYLNYGQYPQGTEAALAALEALEPWEAGLSVFRQDSEVSQVNRWAFQREVPLSDSLWQLLDTARHLWQLTDGAFDITSGSLSQCWGFLKREGRMPSESELAQSLESVGMDKVHLDPESRSIRFLHPQVSLNLGGIGKGWTLDQVASGLVDQGVMDFAFHGGMSSVVARGQAASAITRPPTDSSVAESSETNAGADPGQPGWLIGVADPFYPDRRLGYLNLRNRALGTSGSARQFIHYRGRRLSHILDPRTGLPAEGVLSATVLAPTATQADALGTACFVLGVEGCQALVEVCPDLGILLVVPDGRTCRVVAMGAIDASWLPREESFAARSN